MLFVPCDGAGSGKLPTEEQRKRKKNKNQKNHRRFSLGSFAFSATDRPVSTRSIAAIHPQRFSPTGDASTRSRRIASGSGQPLPSKHSRELPAGKRLARAGG